MSADGAAVVTPASPAGAQPSDGSTAAKGAVFIGGAKIYFMLSGFLQQVLLTRLVGLAEFGAFAVVNNVISIVNNTVVQATIQSVSKFTAEDDARAGAVQRAGVRMQAVLGAVLALAIFLGAPLIAAFEEAPRYTTYFRIAAVIPFLYALYAVFVGSANGLRRFRTQASFDVGFSTAKTILLLGLAALWKVTGAFVGFAAAAAFILVVASRVMRLPLAGAALPDAPPGRLHERRRRLRPAPQRGAQLRPAAPPSLRRQERGWGGRGGGGRALPGAADAGAASRIRRWWW